MNFTVVKGNLTLYTDSFLGQYATLWGMSFAVQVEQFEGPLDLLLQLVESSEVAITELSLIAVVDPFIKHVEANRGTIATEELADFLVIASKLVYLKSKALLPDLGDAELEEGPDLASQLRTYKQFVDVAKKLAMLVKDGRLSFTRNKVTVWKREVSFQPPADMTKGTLHDLFDRVLRRLQPVVDLPQASIERVFTIEEKMSSLHERIRAAVKVSFHRFLAESGSKKEMIVSFLALLELVKQRSVVVQQGNLFDEIHLHAYES